MTFPQLRARTHNSTLGLPQRFQSRADGRQVLFTRTGAGDDPVACMWAYDVAPELTYRNEYSHSGHAAAAGGSLPVCAPEASLMTIEPRRRRGAVTTSTGSLPARSR